MLVTAHLDCLRCTTRNTIITMEITSPTTVIANNVTKTTFTPLLLSELLSLLLSSVLPSLVLSFEQLQDTIEHNNTVRSLVNYITGSGYS